MRRRAFPALLLALLLAPAAARCQEQAPSAKTHRRARGGGGGGSASRGGSSGVPPMKDLPCPPGFTARFEAGPHLKIAAAASAKKKNRKAKKNADSSASPAEGRKPKEVSARRCVADPAKKDAHTTEGEAPAEAAASPPPAKMP
jgi:hypothetical protein